MALEGKLSRFRLAEVYRSLSAENQSGMLVVQERKRQAAIYFKKGHLIFAKMSNRQDRLGDRLIEADCLTEDQLKYVLTIQRKDDQKRRLGRILIDEELVDDTIIQKTVQKQIEEAIYDMLDWDDGLFRFISGKFPSEEGITIQISTENIILEGLRRIGDWEYIRRELPDYSSVFKIAPCPPQTIRDIRLRSNEWNILALIGGLPTLGNVIKMSGLDEDEAGKIIYRLYSAGLIQIIDATDTERLLVLEGKVDHLTGLLDDYLMKL